MRSNWRGLFSQFSRDIGIDMGTANTLVYVGGRGIVLREPSVIAVSREDGHVISVGEDAKRMLGRTPATIEAIRPLRDGVIADYVHTEKMLEHFIGRVSNRFLLRKTVVVGVPSGATEVERRAVQEATRNAGATHAYVIEEPLAAAVGAGLVLNEPKGSIIVDIGGGTTEVAIISMGGVVHSHSLRIGGDELDDAVAAYARRAHHLYIGERTSERAKIEIGSVRPLPKELTAEIKGRDLGTGLPKAVTITSEELRLAIEEPINAIVEAVKLTLEAAPPELAADAMDQGITLAGGGALLRGMADLLAEHTLMRVRVAKDPLACVVLGAGMVAEQMHDNPTIRRMVERASLY